MRHHDQNTTTCIEECLRCYQSCFGMAMTHCLETCFPIIDSKETPTHDLGADIDQYFTSKEQP
jgi:hypothetical protein